MRLTRAGVAYADISEAAVFLKLSKHYVRMLVRYGKLPGVRIGIRFWIPQTELSRFREERQRLIPIQPKIRPPRTKGVTS